MVFDAAHGLQQTFTLSGPEKNITINLDQAARKCSARATLTKVPSRSVMDSRFPATEAISGMKKTQMAQQPSPAPTPTWNANDLSVGLQGDGQLNILNGGTVNGKGYVGEGVGSTGKVTVSGTGSTWNSGYFTYIGLSGDGELSSPMEVR